MIYDLRRTRGIAVILLAAAAIMAVYGQVLQAALRPADGWLRKQRQDPEATTRYRLGTGFERILGLLSPNLAQALQPDQRLGLLLGPSVLWTGIDPDQLGAELGGPHRWANILCSKQPEDDLLMTEMIYSQGLKPDVLILVANPGTIVTVIDEEEARGWYDPRLLIHHLVHRQFREVALDVAEIGYVPFRVTFPYRAQINTLIDRSFFKAQLRLFQAWGSGLKSLFGPDPDPWRETREPQPRGTPVGNQRTLRGLRKAGWFDRAKYRSDSPNFHFLAETFQLAHANRTQTFLVLAPESSAYRAKLPPDDAFHLMHTLANVLGEAAPVVLDFRASAADEDFEDVNHLNPAGKVRMTERLAKAVKPYLK
jgi:hypothetical protein